jgi:hypothetical protein
MSENITLNQQGLFSKQRWFNIRDNRYLFVRTKGVKLAQDYQLDLVALDPHSRLRITVAWSWLIAAGAVLLLLLTIIAIVPGLFNLQLAEFALPVTLGLSLLAFIFLLVGIAKSSIERVFVARNTGYPLVRLLFNNPDKKAFRTFIKQLESLINEVYENVPVDDHQRVAGEIKMLRRLVGHNVVTSQDYEKLKTQLMALANTA